MENSTCKAPFLLVLQGPYEQQNFLNRKPRHTEVEEAVLKEQKRGSKSLWSGRSGQGFTEKKHLKTALTSVSACTWVKYGEGNTAILGTGSSTNKVRRAMNKSPSLMKWKEVIGY